MHSVVIASLAALAQLSACARPQPPNIMMEPATCDSVPPPLAPGERVGGELPPVIPVTGDHGVVVGLVLQARSERPIQAATVWLGSIGSSASSQLVVGTSTNTAGGFTLRARPGSYTLRARAIGHLPRERSISVRAGAVDTVRMELMFMHCQGY